ncbi:MAG: hypothetical protein NUW22_16345 [Acidobacteria bacterium]|nr:hypothetical protein [Acidobacteriota bacterium]
MHTLLLIIHFIGLALGLGTGFALFTLGLAAKDMAPADRGAFMRRAMVLGKNGSIGLLLLILSGVWLVFSQGAAEVLAWGGGMFHVKLTLVVILTGTFGYMQMLIRQAKGSDGAAAMARLPLVGRIMLLLNIAIVVTAVLAFS